MDVFTGIILFLLIWWTALFAVLPWGVNMSNIKPEEGIQAAPANPHLKRKFLITTIVSVILWLVVYMLIKMDIIDFRELAGQMAAMDSQGE